MRTILIVVALVLAVAATVLAFGWFGTAVPPNEVAGWGYASLAAFFASHLVD